MITRIANDSEIVDKVATAINEMAAQYNSMAGSPIYDGDLTPVLRVHPVTMESLLSNPALEQHIVYNTNSPKPKLMGVVVETSRTVIPGVLEYAVIFKTNRGLT